MLHYPMAIRSTTSSSELDSTLSVVLGAPSENGAVTLDAITAKVREIDHPITREICAELLGREATAEVDWWIDNKAGDAPYGDARRRLALAAPAVATQIDAEACLTYQLDQVVMRRRAGVLVLYSWFPEWHDPEIQAALPGPWEMTEDPGRL